MTGGFVKLSDDDESAEALAAAAWDTTEARVEMYGPWAGVAAETRERQTEAARRSIRLLLGRAAP